MSGKQHPFITVVQGVFLCLPSLACYREKKINKAHTYYIKTVCRYKNKCIALA